MADRKDGEYEVGYGKPPKHARFRPGESGNRRGRPRGSKNYSVLLDEELNQVVNINENGRHRKISKRAAIIKHMVNKTLSGATRMLQLLMNELRSREARGESGPGLNLQEADYDVIQHLQERLSSSAKVQKDDE